MKHVTKTVAPMLLALCLTALPALGATPTAVVKGILDEVLAIQKNPALEGPHQEKARAQAIRQVIQRHFDFPYMAHDSLGEAYDRLNAGPRQEFTQVFTVLFQESYTNMVLNFLKRETINYGQETQQNGKASVKTTLVRANDTIPVEYLLHRKGGGWLLYDVTVDDVSILEKYKTGFAREIQARSFQSLLDKMKTQLKALP